MATFTLEQYAAQQAARQQSSGNGQNGPKIHFMGEFLKSDGDQVVVRFPYKKPTDLLFESVHKVIGVWSNNLYGKMVRCTGDDTCPLCASTDDVTRKRSLKFYAKMVVYSAVNGKVEMLPTIWERPAMFADNDLKGLMAEYGDLSNYLFKITKSGSGTSTRYNIIPVNMSSPVYSGNAYAKDLSCLDSIDPVKILTKSIEQYNEALTGSSIVSNPTRNKQPSNTIQTVIDVKVEDKDDPIKSTPVNTTPEPTPATETQAAPSTGLGGTRFKF